MKTIDLSHCIGPDMPVYPGTEPPRITQATTIAADGFAEKLLAMYSHTGTHMDAPAHMLAGGPTLDAIDAGRFVGPGIVLDVSFAAGGRVGPELIERNADRIAAAKWVLLRSGWSRYWGAERYFEDFPVLSEEAARRLIEFDLHGVGVDMISVDPVGDPDFGVHRILLGKGLVIVENLTDLSPLGNGGFTFVALPLRIKDGDGSPVRAAALLVDQDQGRSCREQWG
jgi:kynurenine formamidase